MLDPLVVESIINPNGNFGQAGLLQRLEMNPVFQVNSRENGSYHGFCPTFDPETIAKVPEALRFKHLAGHIQPSNHPTPPKKHVS